MLTRLYMICVFWKVRYLVQINYKSGISMKLWMRQFHIEYEHGSVVSVTYKAIGNRPMFIGVDDIESIFIINKKGFINED